MGERLNTATVAMNLPERNFPQRTQLPDGYHINGSRLDAIVGEGGTGIVFKGHHTDRPYSHPVAFKVEKGMRHEFRFTELEAYRALRESSDNIVATFDDGIGLFRDGFQTRRFVEMEYLPEGSVHDLMQRRGKFPAETAMSIVEQTASGLSVVHRAGFVHLDVEPNNLPIDGDNVKLGDFGMAVDMQNPKENGDIWILGTPEYMAPERAQGYVGDERTDVHGLAMTAYEMFTGLHLRDRELEFNTHLKVLKEQDLYEAQVDDALAKLADAGYSALVPTIGSALSWHREKRQEGPTEFAEELRDRLADAA